MSANEIFSENVRAEMARRDIANPVVARAIGLSGSSFSRKRHGAVWTLEEAAGVARFLGLSLDEMLTPRGR